MLVTPAKVVYVQPLIQTAAQDKAGTPPAVVANVPIITPSVTTAAAYHPASPTPWQIPKHADVFPLLIILVPLKQNPRSEEVV